MSDRSNIDRQTPHGASRGRRGARWAALFGAAAYAAWRRWRRWRGGRRAAPARPPLPPPRESVEKGHEPETTNVVGVAVAAVLLLVVVGGVLAAVAGLYGSLASEGRTADGGTTFVDAFQPLPPEPRLQHDPAVDLQQLHARSMVMLHTYGWADRSRGAVRLPIERAMDLVARRGLPTRPRPGPDTVRVPSESGFTVVIRRVPAPTSPPLLGSSPEPYAPTPDIARMFELLRRAEDLDQ